MTRPNTLKLLYTAGAVVLGGLLSAGVVPPALQGTAQGALVYLVMHSYLPSAKTGAPQG